MSEAASPAFTLLCVDDEANILSALRRLFRPHGYTVLTAGGGEEGLEILAREPVDLIISDMRMPVMDGARFLGEARKRHPDTVRLLLTGYADMESTIAAINSGQIARYIAKPWNDQDVLLTVREALEGAGFDMKQYHEEAFQPVKPELPEVVIYADGEQPTKVTFAMSGKNGLCAPGHTVLQAARAAGVRIGAACESGLCGTCKVMKLSGEVEMDHNGGILDDEIDEGYILACCSRPKGDIEIEA